MKFILSVLLVIPFASLIAQDMEITVCANNNSLTVSPDDDNSDKLFVINTSSSADNNFLTIKVADEEIDKDWKRNFFIYDSADNAIKDFVFMKDESYCIKISDLYKLIQPQKDYFIYTTALPKDPHKAMLVKVARQLVCKIKIL
ncbi:MAG: hypothetical protein ABI405_11335 [Parafilimonas sp.]